MRHPRLLAGAALAAVLPAALTAGRGAERAHSASPATLDARRADASFAALQRAYRTPATGLYAGTTPRFGRRYSLVWPYSQVLAATVALDGIPGGGHDADVRAALGGLARYWDGRATPPAYSALPQPPLARGGPRYYDDNDWIGLALVQAYRRTHDPALLRRAEAVFRFIASGWVDTPGIRCPGGVLWIAGTRNQDRGVVSTAPGSQLASALYLATHRRSYLDWATRMFDWVDRCLRRSDGLYADHIRGDGTRDGRVWSYNQGTMLGAAVLLYRATGDHGYLTRAQAIARAARRLARAPRSAERAYLLAILFDNLMLLDEAAPDRQDRALVQAYADRAWAHDRDAASGVFRFAGRHFGQLLEQAAMVRIYAMLAWQRGHDPDAALLGR